MPKRSLSVLIVEDDPDALSSLCNLISTRYPPFTVRCAENGALGLEAFRESAPDIVLTDIAMPVMDGISMAAEIKGLHPGAVVVAITSHTDTRFLLKAIEIGIDYYLVKPLECGKLYAAIDRAIKVITESRRRRQVEKALLKSQKELKSAKELLEQRVSERTADLQASIREQESFSYSVSHDLRAPLRHINSFSAILAEEFGDRIPEEAKLYLERIRSASNRMGTLIDHLLELSRVGRAELKPGAVNLSELAKLILAMLQETEPKRRLECQVEEGLTVLGDCALLTQLLQNLLGNAWKYTAGKESARIEFGLTRSGNQQAFFVRDNGAGFDMQYKENLFRPFQRLHGSEFEGDGIGLTTAQRIIHRHGGLIWAEGEPGCGSTFYFTLPVFF